MTEIRLSPSSGSCFNFVAEGKEERKTAWIVPIAIRERDGRTIVSWRCNLGKHCEAAFCVYARGARSD